MPLESQIDLTLQSATGSVSCGNRFTRSLVTHEPRSATGCRSEPKDGPRGLVASGLNYKDPGTGDSVVPFLGVLCISPGLFSDDLCRALRRAPRVSGTPNHLKGPVRFTPKFRVDRHSPSDPTPIIGRTRPEHPKRVGGRVDGGRSTRSCFSSKFSRASEYTNDIPPTGTEWDSGRPSSTSGPHPTRRPRLGPSSGTVVRHLSRLSFMASRPVPVSSPSLSSIDIGTDSQLETTPTDTRRTPSRTRGHRRHITTTAETGRRGLRLLVPFLGSSLRLLRSTIRRTGCDRKHFHLDPFHSTCVLSHPTPSPWARSSICESSPVSLGTQDASGARPGPTLPTL